MAQSISREALSTAGLPGATAASRYVGATTTGSPSSGTFLVGDFIVEQSGGMWICIVAGSPGTWQKSGNSTTTYGVVNLTGQLAPLSSTVLFTAPVAGLYQINYYGKVTTPATTSSTLGPLNIISTDPDGTVVTTVGASTNENTIVSGFISDTIQLFAASGTNVQYTLGYGSTGAIAMQYNFHMTAGGTVTNNTNVINVITSGAIASIGNSTLSGVITSGTLSNQIIISPTISGGSYSYPTITSGTITNTTYVSGTFNSPTIISGTFVSTTMVNPILTAPFEFVAIGSGTLSGSVPANLTAGTSSFYTQTSANPTANYVVNLSGCPTTPGQSVTFVLAVSNGATAYIPSSITIN